MAPQGQVPGDGALYTQGTYDTQFVTFADSPSHVPGSKAKWAGKQRVCSPDGSSGSAAGCVQRLLLSRSTTAGCCAQQAVYRLPEHGLLVRQASQSAGRRQL